MQLINYKASSRSPPPPPAGTAGLPGAVKQETASAITSLTLRADGAELTIGGDADADADADADGGDDDRILFTANVGASARRRLQSSAVGYDCRDEQAPLDDCTQALNQSVFELRQQQAACSASKDAQGASLTPPSSFPECDALAEMAAALGAKNEECKALPLPCSGRGACDGETGGCGCKGNNLGPSCGEAPSCRYWDVAASTWGSSGLELLNLDPSSGGSVCTTTHLTDFAVVSDLTLAPSP